MQENNRYRGSAFKYSRNMCDLFQVTSAKASDKLVIRLAHNQAAGSEIADSIALISDITAEDASMNMEVQIYPSGVLGTEKDIIEMVKAGILDMAKVSSNTLGQFKEEYSILPYHIFLTGSSIITMPCRNQRR